MRISRSSNHLLQYGNVSMQCGNLSFNLSIVLTKFCRPWLINGELRNSFRSHVIRIHDRRGGVSGFMQIEDIPYYSINFSVRISYVTLASNPSFIYHKYPQANHSVTFCVSQLLSLICPHLQTASL